MAAASFAWPLCLSCASLIIGPVTFSPRGDFALPRLLVFSRGDDRGGCGSLIMDMGLALQGLVGLLQLPPRPYPDIGPDPNPC
jgi:hypothetical protein